MNLVDKCTRCRHVRLAHANQLSPHLDPSKPSLVLPNGTVLSPGMDLTARHCYSCPCQRFVLAENPTPITTAERIRWIRGAACELHIDDPMLQVDAPLKDGHQLPADEEIEPNWWVGWQHDHLGRFGPANSSDEWGGWGSTLDEALDAFISQIDEALRACVPHGKGQR